MFKNTQKNQFHFLFSLKCLSMADSPIVNQRPINESCSQWFAFPMTRSSLLQMLQLLSKLALDLSEQSAAIVSPGAIQSLPFDSLDSLAAMVLSTSITPSAGVEPSTAMDHVFFYLKQFKC